MIQLNKINNGIKTISSLICGNIDILPIVKKDIVAQNILAHSRNLVEYVALKDHSLNNPETKIGREITTAVKRLPKDDKYLFLHKFHDFLQISKSHYTPTGDGGERLLLKYHVYYKLLRDFVKNEYGLDILHNLELLPTNFDRTTKTYYLAILKVLNKPRTPVDFSRQPRFYVIKSKPIYLEGKILYENTLVPAKDNISKFDRFIVFSNFMIPDNYAIRGEIFSDNVYVQNQKMIINILTRYKISIRYCEIKNFAKIFPKIPPLSPTESLDNYHEIMEFLTESGKSLTDILLLSDEEYNKLKVNISSHPKNYENLDIFELLNHARKYTLSSKPGSNTIKYLASTMRNKVIKCQLNSIPNERLSYLRLNNGCIPFDKMPFASSLINHIPKVNDVIRVIDRDDHINELVSCHIQNNTNFYGHIYTNINELMSYGDINNLISEFNSMLYEKHDGRIIEIFGGKYVYIKENYTSTEYIIKKMSSLSSSGIKGYKNSILNWMEENPEIVNCNEKKAILETMFEETHISLIYGAAGTGKTYLLNHISQYFDNKDKLYLANTHPAVNNLKRKIKAKNCNYMTISKFIKNSEIQTNYDIIFIDECSMVSNSDMKKILEKAQFELLVLVGDTFQIKSITFGNWFEFARYFIPKKSLHELKKPYRTQNKELLDLWTKVRTIDESITECLVHGEYSTSLDPSIFEKKSKDEIILCLNYSGLYGINNINRFLQTSNPNAEYQWGLLTYKINDPVLFNEIDRFSPVIYNNLKGTIVNIKKEEEKIWFEIEVDTVLTELDIKNLDIKLLKPKNTKKSIIGFWVYKNKEEADDFEPLNTFVPFQIAYAVSIHKAQGLEYDSVKIVITEDIEELISHNIFYTAITRTKNMLKIYWSPSSMQKIINDFNYSNVKKDIEIFSGHSQLKILNKSMKKSKK